MELDFRAFLCGYVRVETSCRQRLLVHVLNAKYFCASCCSHYGRYKNYSSLVVK